MRISSLSVALFLGLSACGGGSAPTNVPEAPAPSAAPAASSAAPVASAAPAPSAAPAASSAAPTPAEPPKFAAMSKEEKVQHMKTVVAPKMGKLFKEYDATKYAKFGCATCHGAPKPGDPHDALPKLTFSNGGYEKLQKSKPAIMKFMSEKVAPEMAAAMNEKPYDPQTKQGFGCGGCHVVN